MFIQAYNGSLINLTKIEQILLEEQGIGERTVWCIVGATTFKQDHDPFTIQYISKHPTKEEAQAKLDDFFMYLVSENLAVYTFKE
jgi:hypothetical protein